MNNPSAFAPFKKDVSRLGFGCMRFPTTPQGKIDRPKATALIHKAHQSGITYYDMAWGYHEEEAQYFMGEVLKEFPRDSYYLATKLPPWLVKKEADVKDLFTKQLLRCQVDYFDYYLLHAMNKPYWGVVKECNALTTLARQKEAGTITHLGFSYHGDLQVLKEMLDAYPWDFVQLQLNYLDFEFGGSNAPKEYELVTKRGIPIVVMEPIRGGLLAQLPPSSQAILPKLDPLVSPASWALRWIMSLKNTPMILSGMSTMDQLEENLATFKAHKLLSLKEKERLKQVALDLLKSDTVPCTGCRYCMPCPFGVHIPEVFSAYNLHQILGGTTGSKEYKEIQQGAGTYAACTQCGACIPLCPQQIDVPTKLALTGPVLDGLQ